MLIIPVMLFLTLRSPAVQTYLARKATDYLSRELNATITVGGVSIAPYLNIVLEDVTVLDRQQNILLDTKRMVLDINRISRSSRFMLVNRILFDQATVKMVKYQDEEHFNFQFLVDYFSPQQPRPLSEKPPWDVIVRSFEFRDASLGLVNENSDHLEYGFDPNNFSFSLLNIDVRDIFMEKDTLQATLTNFTVKESKGFHIESITADLFFTPEQSHISNLLVKTSESSIGLDIDLQYDGYGAFEYFVDEVELMIQVQPSVLDLFEMGYFIPNFYGIGGKVDMAGDFSGTVSNLRASNISLGYGHFTRFSGNMSLMGLPVIEETFVNFSVNQFITNHTDLRSVRLPYHLPYPYLQIPDNIAKLGMVSFRGNFTGFLHDFVAYGRFNSALGVVNTDLAIIRSDQTSTLSYRGNIATNRLNLAKLLDDPDDFGNISLSARVEGSGFSLDDLDMNITGEITSLDFKGYNYQQMEVAGNFINRKFSGQFHIDDPNLSLDFGGMVDFNEKIPVMNFTARIDNANLTRLNIYQRDTLYHSIVSTLIHVDGSGSHFGNIQGEINAYSTTYREVSTGARRDTVAAYITTDVIALESQLLEDERKHLRFYSDFLDVQIEGRIDYDKIANSVARFIYNYVPSRFSEAPVGNGNGYSDQEAVFSIHIKNLDEITQVFLPVLEVSHHNFFQGHINTQTLEFSLQGGFDYFSLAGRRLDNSEISITSDSTFLEMLARGDKLWLTDTVYMGHFFASAGIARDTLTMLTQWENRESPHRNLGSLKARGVLTGPQSTQLTILSSYAFVNDSLWTIHPDNRIIIDSTHIAIENFFLNKNEESLLINGKLSNQPEDLLAIELNNFNLENIAFLLANHKVDFSGIASGELQLSNLQQAPSIFSELIIRDFSFNRDHLGDLSLQSRWDAKEKAFRINAEVIYYGNVGYNKPILASGFFYPEREDDNFDLDITIENFKMSVFSRYMESFASNFRGLASGRLRLEGPLSSPELSGSARLVRTGFRVDYLNTTYSFAHDLTVAKDHFRFENLILNDTLGNSARASGIIRHNNFKEFSLDISLMPERMVVLNTRQIHNELFYGRAFASGLVHVHGPVENIQIDVSATALRGTQIFLPLDYTGEITESSFITFVPPDKNQGQQYIFTSPTQGLGFTLNFDLEVTPEAEIQIIFDSQIGDIMRGRGFGNLQIEINQQGDFNMYGDYTIQEGDYLFTLQNLINKRFRMEQGGTIRWTGDPYDADIDIRAVYRTRTSLFDLAVNQADTSDMYRRRVPVETVLHLTDKLFNPTINFEIQLPGSDESTREMVERIINTEQELNRQVFSLLILNTFVPPEGGFNTSLSYGMGTTSSELLSNQLSNWLSQISSDFDIGVNYRPGDEISSQEIEVALSTQLFNDRVILDGNFGVAGDHPSQTQRTSNIIGDVNVEVKITPEGKLRVKAFNRSNTFDVLNTNAPYTQGVGIFFRREFDNFSELFKRERRSVLEIPEFDDSETSAQE